MKNTDFEEIVFTLDVDLSEEEIEAMAKDAELYELPRDVKHIRHNKGFELYCQRNIVSEEWYRLYLVITKEIEGYLVEKEIKGYSDYKESLEKRYYNKKPDFDNMVKMYNALWDNPYLSDSFIEDIHHITSGIWQIVRSMECTLGIDDDDEDDKDMMYSEPLIQAVVDSLQQYEENELAFRYRD